MIYDKSLPARFIIFCSQHYLKLFGLSILLLCALSFHKAFLVLPHPVITKGEIVDSKVVGRYTHRSKYGGRGTIVLTAPVIEFSYDGKKYRIVGGSDQNSDPTSDTKVIFNRSSPQNGLEYSFEGFLDFPMLRISFLLWLFITASLYGLVNLDKHFSLFDFDVKRFSIKWALIMAIPILLLPLLSHAKILLLGARKTGVVVNEMIFGDDGSQHRVILFEVDGKEYRIASGDFDYDEGNMQDMAAPVIYDITNPQNAALFTFHALYFNNWLVATGMGLVFLTGWFFATRMPNDEGTMDE